jgi:deoxyadenosine/deoxycytidine kinase
MWIVIIGGIGTCKAAVADYLSKRREYRQVSSVYSPIPKECLDGKFVEQIDYLMARYKDGHSCKKLSVDEDLISIRSFWDTHRVFSEFYFRRHMIRPDNYAVLNRLYKELAEEISAPNGFIYLKNSLMSSQLRTQLTGKLDRFQDEEVEMIAGLYEAFAKEIRVPVVEVDVNRPFDEVCDEVIFGLDSIQTTFSLNQSIWERRLF